LDTLHFRATFGGLGSTYTGKRVVDFLVVLTELFLLAATTEVLRANMQ